MKMIRTFAATLCLLMTFSIQLQASSPRIAGRPLAGYRIVYSSSAEDEVGSEAAAKLQDAVMKTTGVRLETVSDESAPARYEILVGDTSRPESEKLYADYPFGYSAKIAGSKLVLKAGGCWALDKLSWILADKLAENGIRAGWTESGSVQGEFLFPRDNGVNLRILDDNVWNYPGETIPESWQEIGEDCRDSVRMPQFLQLARAYMPDVMGFQEYSTHFDAIFRPEIARYGYRIAIEQDDVNFTPIYYNCNTVELVEAEYGLFAPKKWSDSSSKSYTSAVMKLKSNGKVFAVISTHLWWKNERTEPGSNTARAAQVRMVMAQAEIIKAKYGCPVFVVGDMNCVESSTAMKQFLSDGYVPCYRAATRNTDNHNGHHNCFPGSAFSREGGDRTRNESIDHCLLYNGGDTEIRDFKCEMSAFTVKLTDHYPNIVDAVLK